jgi:KDO2-lipid IV(A) lauroyltransferase
VKYPFQSALLGCLYAACGLIAQVLRAIGWRRDLLHRHLDRCLPEVDPAHRRAIATGFYSHLGQLTAEVVAQGFLTAANFAERVRIENPEAVSEKLARPGGRVLILSSHHANWEWLLQRCAGAFSEPLTAAWKPTRRAAVNRMMCAWRERSGCRMVEAKELVPHLLGQRGKVRLLAMLADQSPSIKNPQQAWIDFFGQPTAFFRGPGWIGAKMGYTVYLAAMHRERRGYYTVRFVELAAAGTGAEPEQILTAYSESLERHVRRYPDQYFWAYNRWKREKPLYA